MLSDGEVFEYVCHSLLLIENLKGTDAISEYSCWIQIYTFSIIEGNCSCCSVWNSNLKIRECINSKNASFLMSLKLKWWMCLIPVTWLTLCLKWAFARHFGGLCFINDKLPEERNKYLMSPPMLLKL